MTTDRSEENAAVAESTANRPPNAKGIVYAADQAPPARPLIFSAIQHALLLISLGIALPVTVSRAIGLDIQTSTTFLCMTLLCIGISSILQSLQTRFVGCGYQSFAASDSAAISTSVVAARAANNGARAKTDWNSIERGIRACGIGLMITGILGGSIMSTSTSNTGISKATGITSRRVVYVGGALLIVLAFFPRVIGILAIIPEPVLGAALMFATCYIMASGFGILMECELDDRRIFLIFVSIVLATSTLIPGLFSFLPADISSIIVSPIVVGATALVFMKIIVSLGNKERFDFVYDTAADDMIDFNDRIKEVCKSRAVPKDFATKLRIGIDALCESFEEDNPHAVIDFSVTYKEGRIKVVASAANIEQSVGLKNREDSGTTFAITLLMLSNMFDHVDSKVEEGICQVVLESEAE